MPKNISNEKLKTYIAGKQYYRCYYKPLIKILFLENFECPLWKKEDENKGIFDENGFEIENILEIYDDRQKSKFQALCTKCYMTKQKNGADHTIKQKSEELKKNIDIQINETNKYDPKYKNGKIYYIFNDVDSNIYIGSTCKSLKNRYNGHKHNKINHNSSCEHAVKF